MRRARGLVFALGLPVAMGMGVACTGEDPPFTVGPSDAGGGADTATTEGGGPGDSGGDANPGCAKKCAGGEACVDGFCQPEVIVNASHGLVTLNRLAITGTTLVGTNTGAGPTIGKIWSAPVTPNGAFVFLIPGSADDVGGLALDDTSVWYGLTTGNNRGVKNVPIGGGNAADVAGFVIAVHLAVDANGPYAFAASDTMKDVHRITRQAGGFVSCANISAGNVVDVVTEKGNVYFASNAGLGRAGAGEVATWNNTSCKTNSLSDVSVTGLGLDATHLYIADGANNKIKRMPLISCSPAACLGRDCGTIPDGCGGTINCGSCAPPMTCGGGGVANKCGSNNPLPLQTCALQKLDCGTASDGIGGLVECGTCTGGTWCGGGGTSNVCGGSLTDLTAQVTLPTKGTSDSPKHLVTDGAKIYWSGGNGNIWAIKADGTSTTLEQVVKSSSMQIGAIVADATFLYFTDNVSHQVFRVSK